MFPGFAIMDLTALIVFATALLVAAASPGPGIIAIVARVIGRGSHGAVAYSAGFVIGDLVWLTVAILGLAVVAQAFAPVFLIIKYAGAAYLLYLAYRMWTTPAQAIDVAADMGREGRGRLFLTGLAISLGNPKVMAFYVALLPSLIDVTRVTIVGFAELAGICIAVLTLVLGTYVVAAVRARTLFTSPRTMRLLNRTGGTMLAGAAVAVAAK
jgi:threonine/homoserine/homoserine lactone efflux protein